MTHQLHELMRDSLDHCVKCTICETYCPVAAATPLFPGPKYVGPQAERYRGGDATADASLDYCSSCGICTQVCPQGVKIAEINSQAKAALEEAVEALDEKKTVRFTHYWKVLEEQERDEMASNLHEDTPSSDPFKRKRWAKDRIAKGIPTTVGRWRRNFTDDLVWGYVHNDDDVILARANRRRAKAQLDIVDGIVETLEHRMRCISHLCARERTSLG